MTLLLPNTLRDLAIDNIRSAAKKLELLCALGAIQLSPADGNVFLLRSADLFSRRRAAAFGKRLM